MLKPTERQVRLARFIRDSIATTGRPPSRREMACNLGISKKAVDDHLSGLEKKGLLTSESGKHRSLRLTPAGLRVVALPVEMVEPHRCPDCGAATFAPHKPELCALLSSLAVAS